MTYDERRARIQRLAEERGDFVALEDGYVYFFPDKAIGALDAAELRILADILDDKDRAWDAEVRKLGESYGNAGKQD